MLLSIPLMGFYKLQPKVAITVLICHKFSMRVWLYSGGTKADAWVSNNYNPFLVYDANG